MAEIKIIVAMHTPQRVEGGSLYLPVLVGVAGKDVNLPEGTLRDDTGDNISAKNASFCELTGVYWAWKNLRADYVGLVHYRRFFAGKNGALTETECQKMVCEDGIRLLVPKKRRYYIETLYSHYRHTHYEEHLIKTREIIAEKNPEDAALFDSVLSRTTGYMFNMFLMERALFDDYCAWLFPVLFALEERVEKNDLSFYQGRFAGRIGELLFNVWLERKLQSGTLQKPKIRELSVLYTEDIRWGRKVTSFLSAKFFGKKYEESF